MGIAAEIFIFVWLLTAVNVNMTIDIGKIFYKGI